MRLLNTTTIELTEFVGEVPPYAILSHTWGDEEVTFQDMTCNRQAAVRKKGYYSKILGACDQARVEDGLEWVWVDTCCIDKSSSAELSEAINSMFQWYKKARVCYAYLSDVQNETQFSFSRWFTRGWTLQELLAPREIEFYSSTWEFIGTKFGLADSIAHVSGVESTYLRGEPFFSASVAQRMFWASRRKTTREEDIAYCLLGVFGVNMSLIYGEGGTKAFVRLQEEIMRNCNDQSIFAWAWGSTTSDPGTTSYLAQSPHDFAYAGDIVRCDLELPEVDLVATYKGMTLDAPICRSVNKDRLPYYLPIRCRPRDDVLSVLAIPVTCYEETSQEYYRLKAQLILVPSEIWNRRSVAHRYLKRTMATQVGSTVAFAKAFAVRSIPSGFEIGDVWPPDHWQHLSPAPNKHMGQWTSAVWRPRTPTGYIHLKWTGQDMDLEGRTTGRAWPDVLLHLNGGEKNIAGFAVYPGGDLPQIVREFEYHLEQRAVERSEIFAQRLDIGSRYITATVQPQCTSGDGHHNLFVVDVLSSCCRPWSVDNCLREVCGLELVPPELANDNDMCA